MARLRLDVKDVHKYKKISKAMEFLWLEFFNNSDVAEILNNRDLNIIWEKKAHDFV